MKKKLSRFVGMLFGSALLLGVLAAPAFAANDISVKVDDQTVRFTDAAPVIRNDRTFVPFRAIFEQMGAAVQWDGTTQTVIANRDGRDVRFKIGQTGVSITENGDTRTIQTDAAPFIEGSRTYVPIRFASQSFGACVDWVPSSRTVLIVDVAKLLDGSDYTVMDSYLKFAASSRTLSGSAAFHLTYQTAKGDLPVHLTGTASGSENNRAAALTGSVQIDTAAIRTAIEKNEGKTLSGSEMESLLERLSGADFQAIASRADGTLYLSSPILTELGAQEGGWIAIPYDKLAGMALGALLSAPAGDSFADCVAALAQQISLREAPNATVATVRAFLDQTKALYGDTAWQTSGTKKTLSSVGLSAQLSCNAAGEVTGAVLTGTATEDGAAWKTVIDRTAEHWNLTLSRTGGFVSDFTLEWKCTTKAGGAAPAVRPENGAITAWPFA